MPGLDMRELVPFLAVLFCSFALMPSGAHMLELASKMHMSERDYMTVQNLYRGWALAGSVVLLALVFTAWFAMMTHSRAAFWFSSAAFLCLLATQAVFWLFTYPINTRTKNWSEAPNNFESARRQWEFSHAASAVLNLVALTLIIMAVIAR
jgi:hypothetical protein